MDTNRAVDSYELVEALGGHTAYIDWILKWTGMTVASAMENEDATLLNDFLWSMTV